MHLCSKALVVAVCLACGQCSCTHTNRLEDRTDGTSDLPPATEKYVQSVLSELRSTFSYLFNPIDLQEWATSILTKRSQSSAPDIPFENHPPVSDVSEFTKGLIFMRTVYAQNQADDHVRLCWGSGRGFYGLMVGSKRFRPMTVGERIRFRKWAPGVYIFYALGT